MKITSVNANSYKDFDNHELVHECIDEESGLKAYIAIHNKKHIAQLKKTWSSHGNT